MPLTYLNRSTKLLLRHSRVFSSLNKKKSESDVENEKWFPEKLSSYESYQPPETTIKENIWFIP